jgi:hypothetical protein
MKLPPKSYNALFSGLSNAFTRVEIETMLHDGLKKDLERDVVIAGGPVAPNVGKVVEELIKKAEEGDWVRQLLIAALVERPNEPDLLAAGGLILRGAQKVLPDLLRIIRDPGFDLDDDYVTRCYERCADPDGSGEPRPVLRTVGGESALDYGYTLAEVMLRQDRTHPLLEFVSDLCKELSSGGVRKQLTRWLETARKSLGAVLRAPGRREDSVSSGEKQFLLVRVRQVDLNPDQQAQQTQQAQPDQQDQQARFAIQAWHWNDPDRPALLPEEAVVNEAGIEGVVDRAREALVLRNIDLKEVVIEVFLPRSLLDRAVDQWLVDPFIGRRGDAAALNVPSKSRLGSEHKVVVRPLDRISSAQSLNDARSRWERALRSSGGFTVRESAHGYRGKKLVAVRIKNGAEGDPDIYPILRDNGVLCCLFDREPGPPAPKDDPLAVWILTGIPVALWIRRPEANIDVPSELCRLVRDRRLNELPERVYQLRTDPKAPKEGWFLGQAVALLYDDPSRIPVEYEDRSRLQGG